MSYENTSEWTYGAELEFGDVKQKKGLPPGFGWDKRDVTMVNSNGIAVDPKGISYKRGGEVNTPPTKTIKGQVKKFEEILAWFPEASANYRSNLHIHIRVPGLKKDLEACKKIQRYIQAHPGYLDIVEPIPKPSPEQYETPAEYEGASRRYKRRLVSHHKTLSKRCFLKQQKASTMEEFFDAEAPKDKKTGKPLHHLAVRCAVNLRQLKETDTIEFRHFPLSLDPDEFRSCLKWCRDWLFQALNDQADPVNMFKTGSYNIPSFPEYTHWMEVGYRLTVHDGTVKREKIEANIKKILSGELDLKSAGGTDWDLKPSKSKAKTAITIRGTSGSGKSTIVFNLLNNYGFKRVKNSKGSTVGYLVKKLNLFVLGGYDVPSGGCDGLPSTSHVIFGVKKAFRLGYNVLYEGLMLSGLLSPVRELQDDVPLVAITLDTPIETCLKRVKSRRKKAGKTDELNPYNTEQKFKATRSSMKTLKTMGIKGYFLPNDKAYRKIVRILDKDQEIFEFNPRPDLPSKEG